MKRILALACATMALAWPFEALAVPDYPGERSSVLGCSRASREHEGFHRFALLTSSTTSPNVCKLSGQWTSCAESILRAAIETEEALTIDLVRVEARAKKCEKKLGACQLDLQDASEPIVIPGEPVFDWVTLGWGIAIGVGATLVIGGLALWFASSFSSFEL